MKSYDDIIKEVDPEKTYTTPEAVKIFGVSQTAMVNQFKKNKQLDARKVFGRWQVKGINLINALTSSFKGV